MLRALGPSLSGFGLSEVLSDPVLSVYNSSGTLIATNDNWQSDPNHFVVEANGLAPANLLESATAQTLAPGAYTVIVRGKQRDAGDWLGRALRSLAAIQLYVEEHEHPRFRRHAGITCLSLALSLET